MSITVPLLRENRLFLMNNTLLFSSVPKKHPKVIACCCLFLISMSSVVFLFINNYVFSVVQCKTD